jgi:hypothetical protein
VEAGGGLRIPASGRGGSREPFPATARKLGLFLLLFFCAKELYIQKDKETADCRNNRKNKAQIL